MSTVARGCMSGRGQTLRLPAKLRLEARSVRIEWIGGGPCLHPETPPPQETGRWLQPFYTDHDVLPEDFLAAHHDPPAQERDGA